MNIDYLISGQARNPCSVHTQHILQTCFENPIALITQKCKDLHTYNYKIQPTITFC